MTNRLSRSLFFTRLTILRIEIRRGQLPVVLFDVSAFNLRGALQGVWHSKIGRLLLILFLETSLLFCFNVFLRFNACFALYTLV